MARRASRAASRADAGRNRSPEKRAAITGAAASSFLQTGFLGTSVDQIAAGAGVSKQTVYEHFGGKKQLFTEIVLRTIDEVGQPFFERIVEIPESDDLSEWLLALARELASVVKDRRLLELRRLVIAEIARFPELGRLYYERGPGRTVDALAARFGTLSEQGLLNVEDPQLAAQQFNWLVLAIPINRAMFEPEVEFTDAEIGAYAAEAVRVFLAAYASR